MVAVGQTPLLRTGAFARASSLSLKALRLYHEIGLLVPTVVDPDTGYRAYAPAQLADAAVIRRLREVGVRLQDIKELLDAKDPAVTRKVLSGHARDLKVRLDAVTRLMDELGGKEPEPAAGVIVRHVDSMIVLMVDGCPRLSDLGAFMARSANTLNEAADASAAVVAGPFGASFPPQIDDEHQEVQPYLPIRTAVLLPEAARAAGVRLDELPGCDVAALLHQGPYTGLEACYQRLGTWVALHATQAEDPIRENYMTLARPDGDPVTELLWPIVMEASS